MNYSPNTPNYPIIFSIQSLGHCRALRTQSSFAERLNFWHLIYELQYKGYCVNLRRTRSINSISWGLKLAIAGLGSAQPSQQASIAREAVYL